MYNKLFTSILDSSIWLESTPTRIVWVTLLAAMDETGFARFATVSNVALRARVTEDEAKTAIESLESPDRLCPEQEHEGRRIERVDGGWYVLNSKKYRDIVNRETEREQTRIRVARCRAKKAKNTDVTVCNDVKQKVTPSEAEAEAATETKKRFSIPTREEMNLHATKIGLPSVEVDKFVAFYESKGWKVGKNKMESWPSAMTGWKIRWETNRKSSKPVSKPSGGFVDKETGFFIGVKDHTWNGQP